MTLYVFNTRWHAWLKLPSGTIWIEDWNCDERIPGQPPPLHPELNSLQLQHHSLEADTHIFDSYHSLTNLLRTLRYQEPQNQESDQVAYVLRRALSGAVDDRHCVGDGAQTMADQANMASLLAALGAGTLPGERDHNRLRRLTSFLQRLSAQVEDLSRGAFSRRQPYLPPLSHKPIRQLSTVPLRRHL